jgi:hypothetical protein
MERFFSHKKTALSLLQLAIIGGILYALINSSYTKPSPTITKGNWSIEKAVYPLVGGLAGHNYIILRDNNGLIQKEFHGFPTDTATGRYKTISFTKNDVLKAYEFSYPVFTSRSDIISSETVIFGNEKAIKLLWQQGKQCLPEINAENVTYPQLGVSFINETINSNSIADTLLTCMQLPTPHVGLITPGDSNILFKKR